MKPTKSQNKSFDYSRFGMNFRIIIQGTTTTAILNNRASLVGVAILKGDDNYDQRTGILIAIKAAMDKYHSLRASKLKRKLRGFQSNMRNFNNSLTKEINTRRILNGI